MRSVTAENQRINDIEGKDAKEKAKLPPRLIIKTVASLHRKSIYDKDGCHHLINRREAWQVVVGYTGREVYYPE